MNLFSFLSEEDSSSPWGFLSLWAISWDGSNIRTVGSNVGRRLVCAAGRLVWEGGWCMRQASWEPFAQ